MKGSSERFVELARGAAENLAALAEQASHCTGDLRCDPEGGRYTITLLSELTLIVSTAMKQ